MPVERPPFSDQKSTNLLLKITCLCWLLTKLLSWRIWTTDRLLPTIPLFERLDSIPATIHTILFILSLGLILFIYFKPSRIGMQVLLCLEVVSCVLDINRVMPFEYQYSFTICIFLLNFKKPGYIISCIAMVLVSTYFYAGIGKLNEDFLQTTWKVLILRFFLRIPSHIIAQDWLYYGGYLLGLVEMIGGIGLLFKKTQVWSAIVLITIHIFILLLFGPFGYRGYRILWPWNISMIAFLYIIFLAGRERIAILRPALQGWNKLVFLFWGILPAFSFIGYWDNNLSSAMFAGNKPKMTICVSDTTACRPLHRFCYKKSKSDTCQGQAKINIQSWAMAETSVSVYSQIWVYKEMQAKLEKQYPSAGFTFRYFTHYPKNK